jgi:hypothetical protein
MDLKRYRAVRRKLRGKTEAERNLEFVRIIKAGHAANRAIYENARKSGLNPKLAEIILNACHLRRPIVGRLRELGSFDSAI